MAREGFDTGAAVTRSLLGWGVVAGPFYLVFGLILASTRTGFDLTRHPLSALLLGDHGLLQALNLVLTGIMVGAAALGFVRAVAGRRGTAGGVLLGVYALCLVLSAVFPPDPTNGFPPGAAAQATSSGLLHLVFGAIGFLTLGAAALILAGELPGAVFSRAAGVVVIVGFLGGAALSPGGAGIALLWVAVVVGWVWLAVASVRAYRIVPHPELHRRASA
ncbi:hypothetical protein GCM10023175_66740 [Pseudonocardia xishanensis]|uniref:DUF998 domain-containing protein n=2 Tax=Pseudonocardia xishanensis TaxID=630995 RepID=A0ABP8S2D8_9PSEU